MTLPQHQTCRINLWFHHLMTCYCLMLQTGIKCQDWHGSQPCAARPGSCFTISFHFFVDPLEGSGDTSFIFICAVNKNEQLDDNNPDFFCLLESFLHPTIIFLLLLLHRERLFPSCWNAIEKDSREGEMEGEKKNGCVKLKFVVLSPQKPHCFTAA